MGLRPTKVDEKHAERRIPAERRMGPSAFFSGAVKRGKWTGYFVTGPKKRRSREHWAGVLAVLGLAVAALLVGRPSFSNASLPVRGIDDPVIAIQAARSITDVDWVLGNAPSPDREVMRIKQRIGFAFIGTYTALFLTLALLLTQGGGWARIAGPAATICALATAAFNIAENLAVLRILDVPLYETTAPMIRAIRSASFATWALAALTLALLSALFLRSPRFIMRCVGVLFLITSAMQLYGLRDNRFLVWEGGPAALALLGVAVTMLFRRPKAAVPLGLFLLIGSANLHAEVKQFRSYHTHEPSDRNVRFAMAVTPDQDVLSFVAKRDGKWRLTRVRNWLDKDPTEQTIDVPGISVPEKSRNGPTFLALLSSELLVTADGSFAICVATGYWANNGQRGGPSDNIVSVIDLRTLQILNTVHQDGFSEHFVDRAGGLVLEQMVMEGNSPIVANQSRQRGTTLRFFTLPALAPNGSCHFTETLAGSAWVPHDQDCGPGLQGILDGLSPPRSSSLPSGPPCAPATTSRDGWFRLESCQTMGHSFFLEYPTITDRHENLFSVKTGAQIGTVKETTRDSVNSRLAEHNGRDYLLVMEGGTQLKVYEITEPHP
jgi:hypothetical protein